MLKSDFYYDLPHELIAQTPISPRDSSRLLKMSRESGELTHSYFYNLCDFLKKGDLLILNDSKVFPARIIGKKRESGIEVEFLLLRHIKHDVWETMVHPGRRLKKGATIDFGEFLSAEVLETAEGGTRHVKFFYNGEFFNVLNHIGHMPLPPYITEKLVDKHRYNTIYSKSLGSSAAPTAGLHFTDGVFESLAKKGIDSAFITLHVGLGTFRPVKEENILNHHMHKEYYSVPHETANKIAACRQNKGRVIAAGTTCCRALESACGPDSVIPPISASTDIFIYPGYKFKAVDGLITNFHLPESTLLMLVCAFSGYNNTFSAYSEAIKEKYRFFSFGDAMLIL
ncbi:MAG: tRNA preQ1(34) S-adenosylmethionine ribosyltransferase-isomerase QueA [Eubacterium sp.]|nr:tRNA preQ1(34) S-adenosylmethionine ribosyltransferase-isomerase QueA [Eubacterium sp.]